MIFALLGLTVVLCIVVWFKDQKRKIDRMKRYMGHLPGPKPNPFFGNLPLIMGNGGNYGKAMQDLIPKYGEVFGFYTFIPDVVISNAEYVKLMFQSSNERGPAVTEPFNEVAGISGMFSQTYGDAWKFHRRLLSPVFSSANLQKIDWIMVDKGKKLVQRWKNFAANGEAEVQSWSEFQKLSVDVVSHACFAYDLKTLEDDSQKELVKAMEALFDITVNRMIYASTPIWKWFPFHPQNKQLEYSKNLVKTTITKVIETKMAKYNKAKANGTLDENNLDLMDLMLRASQESEDGQQFTVEDIYGESMLFMIAGNETTAITLTNLFNHLGRNPAVQKKLREEIKKAVGDSIPTAAELGNIQYLDMVIKEVLRINPVAYLVRRELNEDTKVGQYMIPRGAALVCSTDHMHNDERYWKEPSKFIPERFTREEEEKRPQGCYLPFGGGLRVCIGKQFALTEIKFTTVMLLREFEIDATKAGVLKTIQGMVTKPAGPCPITIKLLKHA